MLDRIFYIGKKIIPRPVFVFFQPYYHWSLSHFAALFYGFPSRHIVVIGVTGTNGKTTVTHLLSKILESSGLKAASVSSLRFKIKEKEWKNELKMTMPGRFKVQKFLREAVRAGCTHAILEVTSEGIKQFRHSGINFHMAVLTNVTPEHIESHGGFEKYRAAKAELFRRAKIHVLNKEDENFEYFNVIPAEKKIIYTKESLPRNIRLKLPGDFNLSNAAAVYVAAREFDVSEEKIKEVLEKTEFIDGRLEFVVREPFSVVVDYAHTPDALQKVYETLSTQDSRLICVLGAAGGGRDKWKRREFGKIAAKHCGEIILTNEDPYDEDPGQILSEIESGVSNFKFPISKILDRKDAIREALKLAKSGDTVIITGKGAEPWLMGPNGTKIPWDDREVVREELRNLKFK